MLLRPIKQLVSKSLGRLGYEIKRSDPRPTVGGALRQAMLAGLAPASVMDIGAALGQFTQTCLSVFPTARYLAVDPLEEHRPTLEALGLKCSGVSIVMAAAAPKAGTVTLNVHPDFGGSSLYREMDIGGVNGTPRAVRAVTLDGLAAEFGLAGPFVIKLDVQGAELDVLEGAIKILPAVEYMLLEISLFEFFENGPVLADVVKFMRAHGFVAYDAIGPQYRPLDGALSQLDIAFVRELGSLRKSHVYATAEQRRAQWLHSTGRR
jgi:FkbM family methyltransferase